MLQVETQGRYLDMRQSVRTQKWDNDQPPRRILIMRLQAIGDVIITFPFVQLLRNQYPAAQIDFLTRDSQVSLVENLTAVDNVIVFTDSHKRGRQLLRTVAILPGLLLKRYDVVLDLQANTYSTIIRRLLAPSAFTEFEKFTLFTAAERNFTAIQRSGLLTYFNHPILPLKRKDLGLLTLNGKGWDGQKKLIVLNPAGAFPSRHWPLEKYASFAKIWLTKYPNSQFLLLGVQKIADKAAFLEKELGTNLINLVEKTTLLEAFVILSKATLVVSEDSGLMHMAWAQKIPTIALIGSTDKNRSSQGGTHIVSLTSDDLACGNCMKPDCQFGPIPLCLSRYSAEMIVEIGETLLANP